MSRQIIAFVTMTLLLGAAPAHAREWKGLVGFGMAGGAGHTGASYVNDPSDQDARSMLFGSGDMEFGVTGSRDDGLADGPLFALVLRGYGFGPASPDGPEQWSGGGMGVRTGYTFGRIEASLSLLAGSIDADPSTGEFDDSERMHARSTRAFVAPGAEMALVLVRSQSFDLKLRAGYQTLQFDDQLTFTRQDGTTSQFYPQLNAHHVGLAMTFYPGQGEFFGSCDYYCMRMLGETGHLLVQVGSVVGKAAAQGLFRVLVR